MIPDLVEEPQAHSKILPDGVYRATIEEVRERFVVSFPNSVKRRGLFNGWLALRYIIRQLVPVEHEYLDGSFVTSRANPKDIDVSFWVPAEAIVDLPVEGQDALDLLVGAAAIESFSVDAYIVPFCNEDHPLYERFVEWRDWTERAWRTPRDKKWKLMEDVYKGYLEIEP